MPKPASKPDLAVPATAAHPAPGETHPMADIGNEPDPGEIAAATDLSAFGGGALTPTSTGHAVATGKTPDGRNWTTVVTPTGVGSMFAIEPNPEGLDYATQHRNMAIRVTYLGNGDAKVEYKKDDAWVTDPGKPGGVNTIANLQSRSKVYQLAADQMNLAKAAEDKEKTASELSAAISGNPWNSPVASKPKTPSKPKPIVPAELPPGDHPVVLGKWDMKNKSHNKLKEELAHEDLPGQPHTAGDAAAHKRLVASRIADTVKADHKQMVAAAFAGEDPTTDADMARYLDAAEHPEKYTMNPHASSYDLNLSTKDASWPGATPVTPKALKEFAAGKMIQNWAGTSNDHSVKSLVAQRAAVDEFGLENVADWNMDSGLTSRVDAATAEHGATFRAFLRAQYDLTQQDLKDRGITHVNVMRGMKWGNGSAPKWTAGAKTGKHVSTPPLRPLSSWTVHSSTAANFSNSGGNGPRVVIKSSVPASAVLSWPQSGFGCLSEFEFVCLAGVGQVTISSATNVPLGA